MNQNTDLGLVRLQSFQHCIECIDKIKGRFLINRGLSDISESNGRYDSNEDNKYSNLTYIIGTEETKEATDKKDTRDTRDYSGIKDTRGDRDSVDRRQQCNRDIKGLGNKG